MRVRTNTSVKLDEEKVVDFLPILVLDSSGSMRGSKYDNAVIGLRKLVQEFKQGIFIEFSSDIKVQEFKNGTITNKFQYGGTRLNDTIKEVYDLVQEKNKKCLINIFTDGEESHSYNITTFKVKELIKKIIEDKHTFTFQCTKEDLNTIKNTYGVPESNILTYENNAEGVQYAFKMSMEATRMYKSSLAKGEDVTLGFYSKVLNK